MNPLGSFGIHWDPLGSLQIASDPNGSDSQTDRQTDGQTDRQTDTQTNKQTNIWAFRIIESIGPEGRCFEKQDPNEQPANKQFVNKNSLLSQQYKYKNT